MMPTDEQMAKWDELNAVFEDVIEEAKLHPEKPHWQGKKDGIRIALIYFAEAIGLDKDAKRERTMRESSHIARATMLEIMRGHLKSAYHYIDEALWMERTGTKLHPLSRVNWSQWIDSYKRYAKKGMFLKVEDDE